MSSSGMLRCVVLVRSGVSEERRASIIRVTRNNIRSVFQLLFTTNVPSSPILVTLKMEATCSSELSVLIRATRRKITKDGIRHYH
jgi:hypothetical protein